MTTLREAAQQALEALETTIVAFGPGLTLQQQAINALRAALEQPAQEPAARRDAYDMIDRFLQNNLNSDADYAEYSKALDSLYTAPPRLDWVGLTDEEWQDLSDRYGLIIFGRFKLEIEAKLREKNGGGIGGSDE